MWIVVLVLLYPPCRWFAALERSLPARRLAELLLIGAVELSGHQPRAGDSMSLDGPSARSRNEIRSLRDLSPQQWKSGIAAWLGWLFDGLDMHLYTLVAAPFVAELLGVSDHGTTRGRLVQLVDPGGVPGRLGAGRRLLRPHRRPARPEPDADA